MATQFNRQKSPGEIEADNVYSAIGIHISGDPAKRCRVDAHYARTWGQGGDWQVDCGRCKICNSDIEVSRTILRLWGDEFSLPDSICAGCYVSYQGGYYDMHKGDNGLSAPKWEQECPWRIKEAVRASKLPPAVDLNAYAAALAWRPAQGGKGPYMIGPSGSGKTTALWALNRALERTERDTVIMTAIELNRALQKASKEGVESRRLLNCQVLMIDDLGKEKTSPGATSMFYELINDRMNAGRATAFTSRFTGDELRTRFADGDSIGDDIVRRINEVCRPIRFNLPAVKAA